MALHVLVVDDDQPVREACASIAASSGCRVRTADTLAGARQHLNAGSPDVVLLDLHLPDGSGRSLLEEIRASHPRALVTVMSSHLSVSSAMGLVRGGATHVLEKPFALSDIDATLERALERRHRSGDSRVLHERLQAGTAPGGLIAHSPAMKKVVSMISKVASARYPLLISGEHGTGKEVVARTVHANGPHALSPFVPVDCDALEPARLECELFGDAGSGALPPRAGLLAAAEDGTLYLDEIGSLGPGLQARLVRTLDNRSWTPGGRVPLPLRARVIAGSSQDLERLVQMGQFRRDLLYKLSVTHLRIPPLRERPEDLATLVEHCLEEHRASRGIPFALSETALTSVTQYNWPGNVAELETLVAHACLLSVEPTLHFDELTTEVRSFATAVLPEASLEDTDHPFLTLEQRERDAITLAMRHMGGDKVGAARLLGIGKTTLYRKLKEYGIEATEQ